MKSRWFVVAWIVVAVGLLATAVTVTLRTVGVEPSTIPVYRALACSLCGHPYTAELGKRPGRCPTCGKNGVWAAAKCAQCGAIVAVDMERFGREGREPYCPSCRSRKLLEIPTGNPDDERRASGPPSTGMNPAARAR